MTENMIHSISQILGCNPQGSHSETWPQVAQHRDPLAQSISQGLPRKME
jgi:hypothetical protein